MVPPLPVADIEQPPVLEHNTEQQEDSEAPVNNVATQVVRPTNNAEAWTTLEKQMAEYDGAKIQACKDDIDTLLVFAGLFSAIITAFCAQSYQALTQASTDVSAQLLAQISLQLSSLTVNPGFINSTQPAGGIPSTFQPLPSTIHVNSLWFASLIISLVSASLGIFVKQCLKKYGALDSLSPNMRARVRAERAKHLAQWRIFQTAAVLPLLLQSALVLFFVGLAVFMRGLNSVVGQVVTALIATWLSVYGFSLAAPLVFRTCPYQSPFLYWRELLPHLLRISLNVSFVPLHILNCLVLCISRVISFVLYHFVGAVNGLDFHFEPLFAELKIGIEDKSQIFASQMESDTIPDKFAVIAGDAMFLDDEFLATTIRQCWSRFSAQDAVWCAERIYEHHHYIDPFEDAAGATLYLKLEGVAMLVHTMIDALEQEVNCQTRAHEFFWDAWMTEAVVYVRHAYFRVILPNSEAEASVDVESRISQLMDMLVARGRNADEETKVTINTILAIFRGVGLCHEQNLPWQNQHQDPFMWCLVKLITAQLDDQLHHSLSFGRASRAEYERTLGSLLAGEKFKQVLLNYRPRHAAEHAKACLDCYAKIGKTRPAFWPGVKALQPPRLKIWNAKYYVEDLKISSLSTLDILQNVVDNAGPRNHGHGTPTNWIPMGVRVPFFEWRFGRQMGASRFYSCTLDAATFRSRVRTKNDAETGNAADSGTKDGNGSEQEANDEDWLGLLQEVKSERDSCQPKRGT